MEQDEFLNFQPSLSNIIKGSRTDDGENLGFSAVFSFNNATSHLLFVKNKFVRLFCLLLSIRSLKLVASAKHIRLIYNAHI